MLTKARAIKQNPVLALPAAQKIRELSPETKAVLRSLFKELALDARSRAEYSWRKGKAPMAAYWKAVSVYANHIARVCR